MLKACVTLETYGRELDPEFDMVAEAAPFLRAATLARSGRLQLHVDVTSLQAFGHQIDTAANRLAIGIVTAALIIGSAIVMTIEGGPMLLGLPLFGLLGFVGAAAGGAWLLLSIWRSGRGG